MNFRTGLLAIDYFQYPRFPYVGNGWKFVLAPPAARPTNSVSYGGKTYPEREVIINSPTENTAHAAADLLTAALRAIDVLAVLPQVRLGEHSPIVAIPSIRAMKNEALPARQIRLATGAIPLACLIATRASKRLRLVYSISKLLFSFDTVSVPPMELDPEHRPHNIRKSLMPDHHVRYAFAIVAAWSCIEELGFEIRASQANPSKINHIWNSKVKLELEERLRRGHINLHERCLWNLRGPRTRIERIRPPEIVAKSEWARHPIRDGEIEIIDAINYVSFLRSRVTAHRFSHSTVKLLSVYDVVNSQFLARRLLLETMGFWRYPPEFS